MISHTFPTGLKVTVDIPRPRPIGNRRQRKRQRQRWAEKDRLLANTVNERVFHNGLPAELASSVEVFVQTQYRSQATVSVSGVAPNYRSMSARIYLHAAANGTSHAIIGHEVGHVRGYHTLYFAWGGDWKPYLDIRFGTAGDPRLDTSYVWDRDEILAEDIRMFFASAECRREWPSHMNGAIDPPGSVPGLREFLSEWGREKMAA